MKNEKGITLIALLLVIVIIFGCIFAFKVMSDKKETENIKESSNPNTSINNNPTTSNNGNSSSTNNNSNNSIGLGKEFKQAMDSYESFMDEYIIFMKKFQTDRTNAQMIKDYSTYMTKYAEAMEAFEKWEGKELNKEEAKYYVEVQTRVSQKLINASIDMSYQ